MNQKKNARAEEIIQRAAAGFLNRRANAGSLITVTKVETAARGKRANVFLTVFPESREAETLSFIKRERGVFRRYLKEKTGLAICPFVDFTIDLGEKNRQKLENLK